MKDYLNVSEIGGLFGIGVQTLHYYDKIGILRPAYRNPGTGYRKYKFDQIYQLASIRYMRKLGYSIDEVRNFQDSRHPAETIRMLKERSEVLRAQWEELMRIDEAILRKIQFIEDSMKTMDVAAVTVREFPERYYIPIGTEEELYMEDSFYFYPTIAFYEENLKYFGALVDGELADIKIKSGCGAVDTDSNDGGGTSERADGDSRMVMNTLPAGRFLVGYHEGTYETIQQRFDEMKAAYPQYRYSPLIASFNIIDQFVEQDNQKYITQIQIRIMDDKEYDISDDMEQL